MTPHGGARPGAGGPSKPSLTLAEVERATGEAILANGGRYSLRALTDAINVRRVDGAVDDRTKAKRRVSIWWVRQQLRKMRRESSQAGKTDLNHAPIGDVVFGVPNHTQPMHKNIHPYGTPNGQSGHPASPPSENHGQNLNAPPTEGSRPVAKQVDYERGVQS